MPEKDKPAESVASGKMAKYVGTSDERVIDANAWKSIGVEDQNKVTWNRSNNFQVPVADLSKGAVEYLDTKDSGFVIADATS